MSKKKAHNLILWSLLAGVACGFLLNISGIDKLSGPLDLLGQIFLKLLKMIVIPLVFFSILGAMTSFSSLKSLRRVASRAIALFLLFTLLAIVFGIFAAELFRPGEGVAPPPAEQDDPGRPIEIKKVSLRDFLLNMIPANPFESLARGDLLAVIFFAILLGAAIASLKRENKDPLLNFFDNLNLALIKLVRMIMKLAPLGVFALIANTVARTGFQFLKALLGYTVLTIVTMALFLFLVYGAAIRLLAKRKPFGFFKKFKPVMLLGFSTSSSNATLPENMVLSESELGIDKKVVSFVLPLGATINMSGTAIYQGVSAIFIAQIFQIPLSFWQQLTLIFTAITAAVGTAGVPGSGVVTLALVLDATGIPGAGIALILGVERILDMCRTVLNVSGDTVTALIVNRLEEKRSRKRAAAGKEPDHEE